MLGLAPPLSGSEGDKGSAFVFPTACPACGTAVVKEEVGGEGGRRGITLKGAGLDSLRLEERERPAALLPSLEVKIEVRGVGGGWGDDGGGTRCWSFFGRAEGLENRFAQTLRE